MNKPYQNIIERFDNIPECKGDEILDRIADLQRMFRIEHEDLTDTRTDKAQVTYNSSKTVEFNLGGRYLQSIKINASKDMSNYLLKNLDNEHVEMGFKVRVYIDDNLLGGFDLGKCKYSHYENIIGDQILNAGNFLGSPSINLDNIFDRIEERHNITDLHIVGLDVKCKWRFTDKIVSYHAIPITTTSKFNISIVFNLNSLNLKKGEIKKISPFDSKILHRKYSIARKIVQEPVAIEGSEFGLTPPSDKLVYSIGYSDSIPNKTSGGLSENIGYGSYPILIGKKLKIEILDYYLDSKVGRPIIKFDPINSKEKSIEEMLQFLKDKYNQYGNLKPEYYEENDIPINIEVKTGKLW